MASLPDGTCCTAALQPRPQGTPTFRVGLFVGVLIATAGVLSHSPLFPEFLALAAQQTNKCTTSGVRTKCSCEIEQTGDANPLGATLSEDTNEFEIYCKPNFQYAPAQLTGSIACPAGTQKLTDCKGDVKPPLCLDVKTLLYDETKALQWTEGKEGEPSKNTKVLSIPKDNFPFVDGQFLVGCSDDSSTTKCKVAVTVAARATETKDQQVTCSYGKDSNKKHQTITLSPSQNSFTLVCGEKGEIVQTNYKKTYCDVSEENAAVKDCHGKYRDILPGYEEGWWTDGEEKSFTFTIPEDKFPKVGAKMMVQCQKVVEEKPQEKELQVPAPAPPQDSVCSVDVTIETGGSPSSASASFVFKLINFVLLAFSGVLSMSPHFRGL
ncbi:SAG-related sequence [Besnoitia besnoiti]|uniref:SAG-related sequence n=1 Tax=Besnoitia besnoiti TaxID=94643 RepID=A0A2A9MM45_BESBE|nr:SAG-related sequence [Besnoitia besnoiti]PFH36807.1 SAG-related sequence [Besnoitia besnoiti]